MTSRTATVWNDILAHMRLNHPEFVRGWFTDLTLGTFSGGVVEILCVNPAQLDYLNRHCRLAFTAAAQAATGRLISIVFHEREQPADSKDTRSPSGAGTTGNGGVPINAEYTFEHFVTGPCNRLAHAAALAISEEPGRVYNPFFVYGSVGLGKTHLLQAVCHGLRQRHPGMTQHYISCETFINDFIEAVETGALHQFRFRYRHADLLVIDDVQFLAERERSQEEFFHTFNTLYQMQHQIILSADCSPSEIPSLEERLVSRFNSGLVALLDRPCLETRMAIVRKKAKLRCIEVPENVAHLIAGRIDSNIRELEGALLKLDAMSQMKGAPIDIDLAREALAVADGRAVKIPIILEAVARKFDVKISDLQGKRRSKAVTFPRHVSMYLARKLTSQSLEQIGGYFGGRDHSTVLHASRTIGEQIDADPTVRELVEDLAAEVSRGAGPAY
jgi:chromosomal replication initiator protein